MCSSEGNAMAPASSISPLPRSRMPTVPCSHGVRRTVTLPDPKALRVAGVNVRSLDAWHLARWNAEIPAAFPVASVVSDVQARRLKELAVEVELAVELDAFGGADLRTDKTLADALDAEIDLALRLDV